MDLQEGGAVERETGTFRVKAGLAEMLKGGGVKDGTTPQQAEIAEGAGAVAVLALGRGEAGTGNVVEAVRHVRTITSQMRRLTTLGPEELVHAAKEHGAPIELVRQVAATGTLPVVNFAAGGIATPADAALMMQLGVEGNFVGSGIFKSEDPPARARAIVEATTHWQDAERVAAASRGLGPAMESLESSKLEHEQLLAQRGW